MKKIYLLLAIFAIGLQSVLGQTREITGTVTSAEDQSPIPGVSVSVKGTTLGTITDIDGKFNVKAPENAETLVFSFIGLRTTEKEISGSVINVAMEQDYFGVGEVMVVAFGQTTKETFTGSASVIKSDELEKRQVSNISNALTGIASGVQTASNSGQPGESASVRIRGMGSMSASSAPLYVIDNVPYDGEISAISNQDIESITILKDAASNALYGARGANGVILITTKKGKKGEAVVTFDAKVGINQRGVPEYDIMTDPAMYYEKYYEGIYNSAMKDGETTLEQANTYANGILLGEQGLEYNIYDVPADEKLIGLDGKINPNAKLGRVWANDYYLTNDDWYDELFGESNTRQEYNLSVSGGDQKMNIYFSSNYLKDEGIITNSAFDRLTSRLKGEYQVKDWMKIGGNLAYTNYTNNYPSDQEGLSSKNIFYISRIVAPIYPLYVRDANGNIIVDDNGHTLYDYGTGEYPGLTRPIMSIANPASDLMLDKQQYKADALTSRAFADFDITKNLNFMFNVGYDVANTRYLDKGNAYYGQSADFGGNIYRVNERHEALNLQELLTYKKEINEHNFEILLGHETYDRQWSTLSGIKYNLYDPESEEISNAILRPAVYSTSDEYFVEGYLSRLQYNFQEKYYISGSYRRDGSSRFAPNNKWGNFWSVGGSWLINKESFLANYDWVDLLKFKISYGSQGNDALLYNDGITQNYYTYQDQYEVKNSNDDFATEMTYKGNRNLTWETSYNFNSGFDFSLFNEKLDGSIEFFNRKVEDMLFYRPVAPSAGYASYPDNIGSMRNQGIEFDLSGVVVKTNDIKWTLSINGTHYKNKILSLPEEFDRPEGYITGRRILKVGGSIYDQWYPVYMGADPETGVPTWRITNDDGSYGTTDDYAVASQQQNSANLGTTLPDIQGGISTQLNAYGFDFSLMLTYQLGGQVFDYAYQNLMHEGAASEAGTNWHKDILKSWTSENKNTNVPIVDYSGKDASSASSRFLTSASFLSLNNITLGYTFPKKLVEEINLTSLRLYAVADNVALLSKRKGLDPRQSFNGETDFIYSPIRTISVGVNLKF